MNSKVQVKFTAGQSKKLKAGHKKGNSVSVRLTNEQLFHPEGVHVEVSEAQHKKMVSAKKSKGKRGYTLVLSPTQIGGFLQFLIPFLPAIAEGLLAGAATTAASEGVSAISRAIQGKGHCCSMEGGDLAGDVAKLQQIIMDELIKESRKLTGQRGGNLESYLVKMTDTKSMQKKLLDWLMDALKKAVGMGGNGLYPLGVSGPQRKQKKKY
jgi:hypothetical protein